MNHKAAGGSILVAIGSNLPDADGTPPLEICRRAAAALGEQPALRLCAVSRWYRSAAIPVSAQPDYVNGVARLEGGIDPAALLALLQALEARAGRVRGAPNAARVLDLDILAVGALLRDAPDPVLPHPRLHLRAFVLAPLLDVAPNWRHPLLRRRADSLLAELKGQRICVI